VSLCVGAAQCWAMLYRVQLLTIIYVLCDSYRQITMVAIASLHLPAPTQLSLATLRPQPLMVLPVLSVLGLWLAVAIEVCLSDLVRVACMLIPHPNAAVSHRVIKL
jgi:hypothetical protein